MGGGALSSNVSKLGSKEVSKKLRNFSFAIKKACHCEDERSEDVAIAKSLNINEITTQSSIARNDKSLSETNLTTYRLNDLTSFLDTVFSRFTSHFSRKRVAFTLAEVLITLGIIGVVASLTLPSVINNYQKKVVAKRLATSYSTISNAFAMAKIDYDDILGWDLPKDGENAKIAEDFIDKYFLPYFDSYEKVGWMTFNRFYDIKPYSGAGGYFVRLKSGVVLTFAFATYRDAEGVLHYSYPYFNIDINGKNKPNKVGRDRFSFTLFNGKLIASLTYQNSSRTQIIQACKSGNADACTQLIFLNNCEIPDDYPW